MRQGRAKTKEERCKRRRERHRSWGRWVEVERARKEAEGEHGWGPHPEDLGGLVLEAGVAAAMSLAMCLLRSWGRLPADWEAEVG
jgi:hypothetical protein